MATGATAFPELPETGKFPRIERISAAAEQVERPICGHKGAGVMDYGVHKIRADEISDSVMSLETLADSSVRTHVRDSIGNRTRTSETAILDHAFHKIREIGD